MAPAAQARAARMTAPESDQIDRFDRATLDLLDRSREIQLETARDEAATHHRTTIWVVVDADRVLVRSVDGATARWYREAVANPDVVIRAGGGEIEASALVANDDDRVEAASRGYRSKYPNSRSTDAMLEPEVLATTLELVPRDAPG
jgi:hypothetical protein